MAHVFISYSSRDQQYADALAERLTEEGFDVWIDHELVPGDRWWQTIVKAIKSCGAFIVIMSPNSDASPWVGREIVIADQLAKPAMPILLEGSENLLESENWSIYVQTQYANHLDRTLPDEAFFQRLSQYIPRNKGAKGKLIGKLDRSSTEILEIEREDISDVPDRLRQTPPTSSVAIPREKPQQRGIASPLTIGVVSMIVVLAVLGGLYASGFFAPDDEPIGVGVAETEEVTEEPTLAVTATTAPRVDIRSWERDEVEQNVTIGLGIINRGLIDRYNVSLISKRNGREYFNENYRVQDDIEAPTLFIPLDNIPPEFYDVEIRAFDRDNNEISQSILEISLIPPSPTPTPTEPPTATPTLRPDVTEEPIEVSALNTCIEVIGIPDSPSVTLVNVRQSALSGSDVVGQVTIGQQGLVEAVQTEFTEEAYTWYFADWGDTTGWIRSDLLGDCSNTVNYGVDTTGECVATSFDAAGSNIREGAASTNTLVSRLDYLEQASVINVADDETALRWFELNTIDATGWVRADSLGVEGNCNDLDIATNLYPAPLPPETYSWVRGYDPDGFIYNTGVHNGIDLAVEAGTPVRSGGAVGTVSQVEYCQRCGDEGYSVIDQGFSLGDSRVFSDQSWNFGYGHYIIVRYDWAHLPTYTQNQLRTIGFEDAYALCMYHHLQTLLTTEGTVLQPHQQFATSGNSGNSSAPQLAIECRATNEPDSSWARAVGGLFDPSWLFSLAPLNEVETASTETPQIARAECPLTEERIFAASVALTGVFEGNGYATYQNFDSGIVSYGALQSTLASGSLATVINNYVANSTSETAQTLENEYLARVQGRDPALRNDTTFQTLLVAAAEEEAMQQAQLQLAYDNYWTRVVDGYITPRQIELPLSYALLFDMGVNFGVNHGFVRLAEQDLGVASQSVVGQNGITEEELIAYVADLRKQSHDNQAERDNLPALAVRGDFWVALINSGDWLLEGDENGNVIVNGQTIQVCNPDIVLSLSTFD